MLTARQVKRFAMRAKNCRIEKLIRNCPKLSDSVQFGTLTESRYTPVRRRTLRMWGIRLERRMKIAAGMLLLFAVVSGASTLNAQSPKVLAPHRPIEKRIAKGKEQPLPPAKSASLVGGLWMTSPTLKSQMFLKNILEVSSITARPVLYRSNGTRYQLSLVTIEASGTAVVDINSELDKLGIASYATLSGYVEIDYNWAWNPLCVTIRNVDTIHSTIFTYGVQPSTDGTTQISASAMTQVAEGMWWKQEGQVTGFVAVANTSSKSIDASVQVSDSAGNPMATDDMTISPHGTKMLDLPELLYPKDQ